MSDLEPERDEQTELVDDDSEGHQRASEAARARRERHRDAQREDGQLDLDTAAATRRLDEFEDDEEGADG
jgi:hypothetical protein